MFTTASLLDSDTKDPDETHEYDEGATVRIDNVPGEIVGRGYTKPKEWPTYKAVCDDNVDRTFVERELETDRVELIDDG